MVKIPHDLMAPPEFGDKVDGNIKPASEAEAEIKKTRKTNKAGSAANVMLVAEDDPDVKNSVSYKLAKLAEQNKNSNTEPTEKKKTKRRRKKVEDNSETGKEREVIEVEVEVESEESIKLKEFLNRAKTAILHISDGSLNIAVLDCKVSAHAVLLIINSKTPLMFIPKIGSELKIEIGADIYPVKYEGFNFSISEVGLTLLGFRRTPNIDSKDTEKQEIKAEEPKQIANITSDQSNKVVDNKEFVDSIFNEIKKEVNKEAVTFKPKTTKISDIIGT